MKAQSLVWILPTFPSICTSCLGIPLVCNIAGSAGSAMGVYSNGFGAAFTCQMKLWHMGRKMFCPAQAGQLVCETLCMLWNVNHGRGL